MYRHMVHNFESILKDTSSPIAVAVSGGPDSLALLLLAQKWALQHKGRIIALTVDHGLRLDSGIEAERVRDWITQKNIEHVILKWENQKPSSRIQEKAREARYQLLISWCKTHHITTLLLGHHQQDQEETFWLRLTAGSGLEGLTGMKERSIREGVTLLRPLLRVNKTTLKEFLRTENQEWIEDPSNKNEHFFRGNLRPVLEKQGFSSSRLVKTMGKLQEDADFIHTSLQSTIQTMLDLHEGGYISLQTQILGALHPALSKRIVSLCVHWFSESPYLPRSQTVEGILEKLKTGSSFTAGGIYWFHQKDKIYLSRELSAIKSNLLLKDINQNTLWDHRFWIDPKIKGYLPEDTHIAPLGPRSWDKETNIPRRLLPALPALWIKEKIAAVPHLCYTSLANQKDLKKFIFPKPLF